MRLTARAFALTSLVALSCVAPPAQAEDFYAGKQITLIAGAATGGGYDLLARLVARHLGQHLPGNPTVVVQNMPAANSLAATNHLANIAARDGTIIGLIQRGMLLARVINPSGVQFDLSKLRWIGNLNSETAVTLAWNSAPHVTAKDLFDKELVVGGQTGVDPEITPRLYNALLGTKFKIINGYNGTNEIGLAMERGEVQGVGDWSWSSLKVQKPDWLRDKKVRVLLQGALQKDPELPDLPNALDFVKDPTARQALELYFTQKTVARPMITPPDVPADRLALLRKAFMALGQDKDFLEDAARSKVDIGLLSGEDVEKVVALIGGAKAEAVERFTSALAN